MTAAEKDEALASRLPARLARLRAAQGLTQAALAALIGVSAVMLNRWERGRALPRAAHLAAIDRIEREGSAPPVRSPLHPDPPPLPLPLGVLVGREAELAALALQLRSNRLLTLSGPGGAGKTRLALELARREVERFAHGVVFVELAGISDAALVEPALAAAIGARTYAGVSERSALLELLRTRRTLLLLDNCEHVLSAVVELALAVLPACAGVQMLVTSREPLGVRGELVWQVAPLGLPPASATSVGAIVAQSEAVQLFVTRARERLRTFAVTAENIEAIAQLCGHLDGLPLALELAAAWTPVASPAEIGARIAGGMLLTPAAATAGADRHQTLAATAAWSVDLLPAAARLLFERLAVFSAGFDLETATAVCADETVPDVLAALAHLVRASLVVAEPREPATRYRLLETLRAYAETRLEATTEPQRWRERHAGLFAALAKQSRTALLGSGQLAWLTRMRGEQINLQQALTWLQRHDVERCATMCEDLYTYWYRAGLFAEGRSRFEAVLAPGSDLSAPTRDDAARCLGDFALQQGDYRAARPLFEESILWTRRSGTPHRTAVSANLLALVLTDIGEFAAALALVEEALALPLEHLSYGVGRMCLGTAGYALTHMGRYAEGERHLAAAVAASEREGDGQAAPVFMIGLGDAAFLQGKLSAARRWYRTSVARQEPLGFVYGLVLALERLANLERRSGNLVVAHALLRRAFRLRREHGIYRMLPDAFVVLTLLSAAQGHARRAARLGTIADRLHEQRGGAPIPMFRDEFARVKRALGSTLSLEPSGWGRTPEGVPPFEDVLDEALSEDDADRPQTALVISQREREVLRLLASGATNREIASMLRLSVRTIEHHLLNVYAKTGTRGRADVTAYALRHALVSL